MVEVPLGIFWLGTFIGVAPPCLLYVEAGHMLQELSSTGDIVSMESLIKVILVGCLALVPVVFKEWFKKKVE